MSLLFKRNGRLTARVNVVHPDAVVPEHKTGLAAGFDLALVEPVFLEPGEAKVYSTGLVIQPPEDHMLLVVPRSSTFRKYGLTLANTVGILDEDFCGPEDVARLYLYNPTPLATQVAKGIRLAQGIFVPITRATFEVVDGPLAQTRGGWGSTGD